MSDFGRFLNDAAGAFASEYSGLRRDRKAREHDLKKQKILTDAQESLWKKQATAQLDKEERVKKAQAQEREDKAAALGRVQKAMNYIERSEAINPPRPGFPPMPRLIPTQGQVQHFAGTELTGAGFSGADKTAEMGRLFPKPQATTKPDRYKVWDEKTGKMRWAIRGPDGVVRLGLTSDPPRIAPQPTAISELKALRDGGKITDAQYIESLLKKGTASTIDLQKSTLGNIEKRIIDISISLETMDIIEELYDPSFLKVVGKSKAWIIKQADKLGIVDTSLYLRRYAAWNSQQSLMSLFIRKQITGVAGGEKEMELIMGKLPDPAKDSPNTYEAKFERQKQIYILTVGMLNTFREANGFPPSRKQKKLIVGKAMREVDTNLLGLSRPPGPPPNARATDEEMGPIKGMFTGAK